MEQEKMEGENNPRQRELESLSTRFSMPSLDIMPKHLHLNDYICNYFCNV